MPVTTISFAEDYDIDDIRTLYNWDSLDSPDCLPFSIPDEYLGVINNKIHLI